jgi:adenylate cyclase
VKPGTLITGVGLLALAVMLGLFAARPWVLDRLELGLLDWRFRLRGPTPTTGRVVYVSIDEKSVDELGRWPWRRSVMARLIDRLTEAEVAAIGLDIVFSEPEIAPEADTLRDLRRAAERAQNRSLVELLDEALENAQTDRLLAEAISRSDRTVLGYFFRTTEGDGADEAGLERDLPLVRKSRVAVARIPPEGRAPILTCTGVEPDLEQFQAGARRLGFFSTLRDRDGVVRRVPLVALCRGELYVSLALALLETVAGKRAMVLGDTEGIREVRLGETILPTDEGGRVLVNFRGPVGTFPTFSASDVVAGRIAPEELRNRVVLIGATEVGIGDLQTTPFGTAFPGVEVHASVLDNLLAGSVLRRHDGLLFVELGTLVLLGLLVTFVVPRLQSVARGAALTGILLGLLLAAALYAFVVEGVWVNLTYPGLTLAIVYVSVAVTHGVTIEARGRQIRRNFATYVPPEVVNEMIEHPESFRLGGERRDLSILFSDVRDFTTLAEEIGPDDVSHLLHEYLGPMTHFIFESRGTLDKYIGDAIVAFWGAPLPVEGHPSRACRVAVAMQEEVARLRSTRPDLTGATRLRVGIGIHSAEVVVGNMGSELRFDYTVTGDGVNLCSRLEGLTKFYGVGIIASQDLVGRVQGFGIRELDTIRVKGKKEAVRIFEILGREDVIADASEYLEAYADGLRAYREGRWTDAERALGEVLAMRGQGDQASALLLERIQVFKRDQPPDWDGVWTFAEK